MAYAIPSLFLKIYTIYKYFKFPVICLVIYISFFFILHEYTQIRLSLAMGFLFLAVHNIESRRSYYLLIMIAVCCHFSAAIYLFLRFILLKLNIQIFLLIAIGLLLTAIYTNFYPIMDRSLVNSMAQLLGRVGPVAYLSYFNGLNLVYLITALISAVVLRVKSQSDIKEIYTKLVLLGCSSQMLFTILSLPVLSYRVGYLFLPFYCFMLANLINKVQPKLFIYPVTYILASLVFIFQFQNLIVE